MKLTFLLALMLTFCIGKTQYPLFEFHHSDNTESTISDIFMFHGQVHAQKYYHYNHYRHLIFYTDSFYNVPRPYTNEGYRIYGIELNPRNELEYAFFDGPLGSCDYSIGKPFNVSLVNEQGEKTVMLSDQIEHTSSPSLTKLVFTNYILAIAYNGILKTFDSYYGWTEQTKDLSFPSEDTDMHYYKNDWLVFRSDTTVYTLNAETMEFVDTFSIDLPYVELYPVSNGFICVNDSSLTSVDNAFNTLNSLPTPNSSDSYFDNNSLYILSKEEGSNYELINYDNNLNPIDTVAIPNSAEISIVTSELEDGVFCYTWKVGRNPVIKTIRLADLATKTGTKDLEISAIEGISDVTLYSKPEPNWYTLYYKIAFSIKNNSEEVVDRCHVYYNIQQLEMCNSGTSNEIFSDMNLQPGETRDFVSKTFWYNQYGDIYLTGDTIIQMPDFNFSVQSPDWELDIIDTNNSVSLTGETIQLVLTSTEDISKLDVPIIYPNPSFDHANISHLDAYLNGKLKVFNAQGQLVYSTNIENHSLRIDSQSFSSGLYYINIQKDNTAPIQLKWLKQ